MNNFNWFEYKEICAKLWMPMETAPKTGIWLDFWAIPKNGTQPGVCEAIGWAHGAWRWPSLSSAITSDKPHTWGHDVEING